jgi:hypothetical protein
MRDRVIIIGDVTSGFRIHGMFEDNHEAHDYVERHRDKFLINSWAGSTVMLQIVNFDTMTVAEVAEYESKVGHGWADLVIPF